MKSVFRIKLWLIVAAVTALGLLTTYTVSAHERREVGKYQFIVGFIVEPAFEGIKNGVDLRVNIPAEVETEEPTPIEGVEETLQVEVTHVPSGVSKTMPLRTIFRDPGHYTADLIPTVPGQYRFRFFGTVEGLEVNETFESGPDTFGNIEPAAELHFPEQLPEIREVEGAVRGAQETAVQIQDGVASARSLAITGIVLGAIGLVAGVGSAAMTFRRR